MKLALLALPVLCLAGCEVDTSSLEPLDGYADWHRVDNTGEVPGHGDSYRIIYVNDVARRYAHAGQYAVGSVIVKEIRADDDGLPGDLSYVAIMRKLAPAGEQADGFDLEGGWLFTHTGEVGETELQGVSCWGDCHVQAPYDGAWIDYGY